MSLLHATHQPLRGYQAQNFHWSCSEDGQVATLTLARPQKKNALSAATITEMYQLFQALSLASDIRVVVLRGAGGDFCAGGDLEDIVAPMLTMPTTERLAFNRITGGLVGAMRKMPQPIIAEVDGVCAGGGAVLALAADIRLATPAAKVAFLFARIGLSGADMGASGLLPRIIGQGRATELLLTGRFMSAEEGLNWGFFTALHDAGALTLEVQNLARTLADGPAFAHGITKTMLNQEWNMSIDALLEAEAQAQALCMTTEDFRAASEAFAARRKPVFSGR